MESTLNRLILLNVELEGLLRVAAARPSDEALRSARAKFDSMASLFDSLTPAEARKQADTDLTDIKYDEAENGENAPDPEPSDAQIPFDGQIIETDTQAETVTKATPAAPKAVKRPDIRSLLTLNDKFLFRRELFDESDTEMTDTLNLISSMDSLDEAREYLLHDLQWDETKGAVADFLQLVGTYFKS
ncbi:MAG: hypothetical protein K2M19_09550 [Muribaculaceae bacterium]|nr:hypothetical protein [Muribaculaceae bacterium]